MLLENTDDLQTQVRLIPYQGMVNPEHLNRNNCVPWVMNRAETNDASSRLEKLFIEDFIRKSREYHQSEQIEHLPIEIRLGTVYTYQNRRQQEEYPNGLRDRSVSADFLRHEEHRPHHDKDFLITFNKNKGINNLEQFDYQLTCTGFRLLTNQDPVYRLYLRCESRRIILELKRNVTNPKSFSVKRLLRYTTKFRHIDLVKSKVDSDYLDTFDDIFDIRTIIGKAVDEEELHINDEFCNFLQIKDLEQCVQERVSPSGQTTYQFNRHLLPYFDFFQIKQCQIYHYSCIDSQYFGVKIFVERQIGYDLSSKKSNSTSSPCLQTNDVIMAKLILNHLNEDEARRVWNLGHWLSSLASQCTSRSFPENKTFSRRPKHLNAQRKLVR